MSFFFFERLMERKERDPSERATPKRSRCWTRPWWAPVHDWSALSPRPEAQRRLRPRGSTGRRSIHRLAPPLVPMGWRGEITQHACAGFSSRFEARIDWCLAGSKTRSSVWNFPYHDSLPLCKGHFEVLIFMRRIWQIRKLLLYVDFYAIILCEI